VRGAGIYPEQEPIPFLSGVSTWSRNQSHEGRGYIAEARTNPICVGGNLLTAETNPTCVGGIYPEREPIPFVSAVSTRRRKQSHVCWGYAPGARTNPICVGGIYPEREPIPFVPAVSTRSRNQSHSCRGYIPRARTNPICVGGICYIPGAGTNPIRVGGIYPEREPFTQRDCTLTLHSSLLTLHFKWRLESNTKALR